MNYCKRQQAPWDLARVVVVVVKRKKQDEGQILRDDGGFVLVVCFSAFVRVAGLWLSPAPSMK